MRRCHGTKGLDQLGPIHYTTTDGFYIKSRKGKKRTITARASSSATHRRVKVTLPKLGAHKQEG